jgi:hypothetical protein
MYTTAASRSTRGFTVLVRAHAVLKFPPGVQTRINETLIGCIPGSLRFWPPSSRLINANADREPICPRLFVAVPRTPSLRVHLGHPQKCAQSSGKSTSSQEWIDSSDSKFCVCVNRTLSLGSARLSRFVRTGMEGDRGLRATRFPEPDSWICDLER